MTAKVLVLSGYGLNCEEESLHAFERAGLTGAIRHINDLIENPKELEETQILMVPGGFSYGDDTGSGNAFAQKIKLSLWDHIQKFALRDTLTLGICNGCQILANLGLVPASNGNYGERIVAVTHNASARYQCRWIDVKANANHSSPWLSGLDQMHIPVAHGEGRFMMEDATYEAIKSQIAFTYVKADGTPANEEFPFNPNGSMHDIAALTDTSGRVLAMMPHPERGMFTWQRDDYDMLKDKAQRAGTTLAEESDGMALFHNAASYFEVAKRKSA